MLTTLSDEEIAANKRTAFVAMTLANHLDMMLLRYKTQDGKVLTEGEVQIALGSLIGSHCKTRERAEEWLRNVATMTFHQQVLKEGKK